MTITVIVYDYVVNGTNCDEATFWPPNTANAWDGKWHKHGYGFIRYVKTFWGGGCFQRAVPAIMSQAGDMEPQWPQWPQ